MEEEIDLNIEVEYKVPENQKQSKKYPNYYESTDDYFCFDGEVTISSIIGDRLDI
jgi:hypothetical protein